MVYLETIYAVACVPLFGWATACFARYAERRAWQAVGAAWFLLGVALLTVALDAFRSLLFQLTRVPSAWMAWVVVGLVGGTALYSVARSWRQLSSHGAPPLETS